MKDLFTPRQTQQFKGLLMDRRAALADQRNAHLGGQSRADHARELLLQDSDDATQRGADREVDFARTDRDSVVLAEIDRALARIEAGQYGLCIDCGEAIAPARLKSAPQVPRCIVCETRLEQGQPRPATL